MRVSKYQHDSAMIACYKFGKKYPEFDTRAPVAIDNQFNATTEDGRKIQALEMRKWSL